MCLYDQLLHRAGGTSITFLDFMIGSIKRVLVSVTCNFRPLWLAKGEARDFTLDITAEPQ